MTHRIVIAGAGGIGRAAGLLLVEWGEMDAEVWIGDAVAESARSAVEWIRNGATREDRAAAVHAFTMPAEGSDDAMDRVLTGADALLDCLPWPQAVRMARLARRHDLCYANLTEHVESSREIAELAEGASRGFVLQTGLAPGFIDVLGHELFLDFCRRHGVDGVDRLMLRVGALPVRALPPHYYGFTWNLRGVATEYLEPSVVVRDGRIATRPSLDEVATIHLGGLVLEEALTSGGAADLPEHFTGRDGRAGRVRELDYKTLRHPGHWEWVRKTLGELDAGAEGEGDSEARIAALEERMSRVIPHVEADQVVIYAAVEGEDRNGVRRRIDDHRVVRPRKVGRHTLRAIQLTTAAALVESARMLLLDDLSGVVLQSGIEPERWLAGPFVSRAYSGDGDG